MSIACPHCDAKLRFGDLYLFRLRNYRVKCQTCGTIYTVPIALDVLGIVLVVSVCSAIFGLAGYALRLIRKYYYVLSGTSEALVIGILLFLAMGIIVYGHPYFIGWHIRKKYREDRSR